MVRVANSGISFVTDATGRRIAEMPLGARDAVDATSAASRSAHILLPLRRPSLRPRASREASSPCSSHVFAAQACHRRACRTRETPASRRGRRTEMANARSPNPIDVHVGSRVKLRRAMLGLSQEKLGEALGVTFQQVQKYEKGTNRIGASRMQAISDTLQVPIGYFYEGAPVEGPEGWPVAGTQQAQLADSRSQAPLTDDLLASPEGIRLNRAFVRIGSVEVRRRLADLVVAMADAQSPKGMSTRAKVRHRRSESFFGRRKTRGLSERKSGLSRSLLLGPADRRFPLPSNPLPDLFNRPVDSVHLEIGFGGGEHLLYRAGLRTPDRLHRGRAVCERDGADVEPARSGNQRGRCFPICVFPTRTRSSCWTRFRRGRSSGSTCSTPIPGRSRSIGSGGL